MRYRYSGTETLISYNPHFSKLWPEYNIVNRKRLLSQVFWGESNIEIASIAIIFTEAEEHFQYGAPETSTHHSSIIRPCNIRLKHSIKDGPTILFKHPKGSKTDQR